MQIQDKLIEGTRAHCFWDRQFLHKMVKNVMLNVLPFKILKHP